MIKMCKKCGVLRPVKKPKKQISDFCRVCGLREIMDKRSLNEKWKESLSRASKGKPKSEKHKAALSIAAKERVKRTGFAVRLNYHDRKNLGNSWTINRHLTLERDGKRCRHCGFDKQLQVHHLNPFKKSKNNNLGNLITLCIRCHRRAEEGRIPLKQKTKVCGVLLAGGRGTRLSPITLFHNKHELPVGPIPMIFHPIKILRSLRVTDVLIILDRNKVGRIIEMLGDGSEFGMNFTYKIQNDAGGIAEALALAEDYIKNRIMYVILGDNIFEMNEFDRPPSFWSTGCVFLKEVLNPKDYGVAELKDDRVIGVEEKPLVPKSNLVVTGLYAYKPTIFKILKNFEPSKRGELEISDLNNFLAKNNDLSFKKIKGEWMDAGSSFKNYVETNFRVLQWLVNESKR